MMTIFFELQLKKYPKIMKRKSLNSETYQKMNILRVSRQIPTNQCILHTKHNTESLVCNKDGTERPLIVHLPVCLNTMSCNNTTSSCNCIAPVLWAKQCVNSIVFYFMVSSSALDFWRKNRIFDLRSGYGILGGL